VDGLFQLDGQVLHRLLVPVSDRLADGLGHDIDVFGYDKHEKASVK
jgi:hypothetical protein